VLFASISCVVLVILTCFCFSPLTDKTVILWNLAAREEGTLTYGRPQRALVGYVPRSNNYNADIRSALWHIGKSTQATIDFPCFFDTYEILCVCVCVCVCCHISSVLPTTAMLTLFRTLFSRLTANSLFRALGVSLNSVQVRFRAYKA
jgi:hypothetical protein